MPDVTLAKMHNYKVLSLISTEITFHAAAALDAIEVVLADPVGESAWEALYAAAFHAACTGSFMLANLGRKPEVLEEFPGREEMFRLFTGVSEDMTAIKHVRDAMIHSDERLEAEWIRLERNGKSTEALQMRAIGVLPDDGSVMVNWDPRRIELSGREAITPKQRNVAYYTVNLRELRTKLLALHNGASRFEGRVSSMRPGKNVLYTVEKQLPPQRT
jgi:hypothetical protein